MWEIVGVFDDVHDFTHHSMYKQLSLGIIQANTHLIKLNTYMCLCL